jgi:basic membrane protein A
VDLAVWQAAKDLQDGAFTPGDTSLGLKEEGVGLSAVRVDFPGKAAALQRVEALRDQVASGAIKVPATVEALGSFTPPAP